MVSNFKTLSDEDLVDLWVASLALNELSNPDYSLLDKPDFMAPSSEETQGELYDRSASLLSQLELEGMRRWPESGKVSGVGHSPEKFGFHKQIWVRYPDLVIRLP